MGRRTYVKNKKLQWTQGLDERRNNLCRLLLLVVVKTWLGRGRLFCILALVSDKVTGEIDLWLEC